LTTSQPRHRFHSGKAGTHAIAFTADGRFLAAGDVSGTVRLWRLADGKLLREFTGHRGPVTALAFAADASVLVSASQDATALVWDLAGLLPAEAPPAKAELPARELDRLWHDLGDDDVRMAGTAVEELVRFPKQVVPLLRQRLKPVPPEQMAQLVARLDDETFEVREKASQELARLGRIAVPALRKALEGSPSAEMRRRVKDLLDKLPEEDPLEPAPPRVLRALEILERIDNADSREVLRTVAAGSDTAQATVEARAALLRLGRPPKP
jgi:hypothetical protein